MNKKSYYAAPAPLCPVHRGLSFLVHCWRVKRQRRNERLAKYRVVGDCDCRLGADAGTEYVKTGATLGVIIFTTLIINLRHVLYSASISGTVREASFFKNALCPMRSPTRCMPPPLKRWKEIKGKISVLWLGDDHLLGDLGAGRFSWRAGRRLVSHIEKYGLDFAMVAAFIAIVVPQIKSRPAPSPR